MSKRLSSAQIAALQELQRVGLWRADNSQWVVGDKRHTTSLLESLVRRGLAAREISKNGTAVYTKVVNA